MPFELLFAMLNTPYLIDWRLQYYFERGIRLYEWKKLQPYRFLLFKYVFWLTLCFFKDSYRSSAVTDCKKYAADIVNT